MTVFLALRPSFAVQAALVSAKDVHCDHDGPHSLLIRGQSGTVTWDELA